MCVVLHLLGKLFCMPFSILHFEFSNVWYSDNKNLVLTVLWVNFKSIRITGWGNTDIENVFHTFFKNLINQNQ